MDFYDYWILKTNISTNLKIKLIGEFGTSKNIFTHLIIDRNISFVNLSEYDRLVKTYNDLKETFDLNRYNETLNRSGIKFLKITDDDYPHKLKNISSPPFAIFYKGNINFLNSYCISIVGTRNATPYGEEVCKKISKELSLNNINIVSGGARGIDILSHKICLENNGIPICVLGSGLLNYYPKENSNYFDKISEVGCLISEYDLYTKPDRYNFPERNRIISAIGDGLIVVEAKEKSGTMITVKYALDFGKDIAAVPGPIFWEKSSGCNKLIKDGAAIISSISDLYEIFNIDHRNCGDKTIEQIKYGNLFSDPNKYKVFSFIKSKPSNVDEIINSVEIDLVELYKILFELEYLNIIEVQNGNLYHVKAV